MIEALPSAISQAQGIVHDVIKITADARGTHPRCFGSQVEALSDHTRLPEQLPIRVRTTHPEDRLKLRQHSQTEGSIGSDVLMAGNGFGEASQIGCLQFKQRAFRGLLTFPEEVWTASLTQGIELLQVANVDE